MIFEKATIQDISALTDLRITYLQERKAVLFTSAPQIMPAYWLCTLRG